MISINKRKRGLPREELEKLDKSQLIDKIQQLEAYNFQLKNILKKKLNEKSDNRIELNDLLKDIENTSKDVLEETPKSTPVEQNIPKKLNKKRQFDFSKSHKRHVLIKLLYFGWDYQGFAEQEDSHETIEHYLFEALTRTCLIESRTTSNYHRCGRTDKTVSAFSQVISIDLRSKFSPDEQFSEEALAQEIDYCGLLNRILPRNIQCVAWMPLKNNHYSARFDCIERTYRYYFPRSDLNIDAMQKACTLLQKHTDFRNFCKMDVHNGVINYVRNLQSASINMCPHEKDDETGYTMYYLEIRANAFLWHQIRCIMAILLLIGQNKEKPEIICDLLDIEKNPCKPQYTPAIGLPLNLFECKFRQISTRSMKEAESNDEKNDDTEEAVEIVNDILSWNYNEENLQKVIENIQMEWTLFNIKSTMLRNVLYCLEDLLTNNFNTKPLKKQEVGLQDFLKSKQYTKILDRNRCESLENRFKHYIKKQRLIVTSNNDDDDT